MIDAIRGSRSTLGRGLRVLNGTTRRLRPWIRLDEGSLTKAAMKQTGLKDFGNPQYREGLVALIESAEKDAKLHLLGRWVMRTLMTRFLINRLLLVETQQQQPEIFHIPLIPPLVILGLPRSGTTFLHGMLAIDAANRAIPAWQTMRPIASGQPDRRRSTYAFENKIQSALIPKLGRMHYSRVDTPEECVALLGTTFTSAIFSVCAPVYGYGEWLNSQDPLRAYEEYVALLKIIQSPDPSRRFALKSPVHTNAIDTLLKVMPDALIIQTHRHPVPVCNSTNSLVYEMHNLVTEQHDIPRLAKTNVDNLVRWVESSMAVRDTGKVPIHDVHYDDLLADPVGTVQGIYDRFGLAWTAGFERQLQAYVDSHPQGQHGSHTYCGSDFGLDDDETAQRFRSYIERFGL